MVRRENTPVLPASDWSVVRIRPCFLRLNGPRRAPEASCCALLSTQASSHSGLSGRSAGPPAVKWNRIFSARGATNAPATARGTPSAPPSAPSGPARSAASGSSASAGAACGPGRGIRNPGELPQRPLNALSTPP
eukprot:1188070-Prorocentrum_minimum.AAC.2